MNEDHSDRDWRLSFSHRVELRQRRTKLEEDLWRYLHKDPYQLRINETNVDRFFCALVAIDGLLTHKQIDEETLIGILLGRNPYDQFEFSDCDPDASSMETPYKDIQGLLSVLKADCPNLPLWLVLDLFLSETQEGCLDTFEGFTKVMEQGYALRRFNLHNNVKFRFKIKLKKR